MEEKLDQDLTEEQLSLIHKISDNELHEIDNALLFNISNHWVKLARVIGTTMNAMENRTKGIPDVFYAQRVKALIDKGLVESQGNLNAMRFCEVRKL